MSNTVSDQDFMAYANNFEKEEKERQSRSTGGFTPQYEELKWTGLEPDKTKAVRVLGGRPDAPTDKGDARIVNIAWIKGDDGKNFRCVLPSRDTEEGKAHLLWRVISRVKEVAYVNRKRVYVNETKHKEIFDMVMHNRIPEGDPKRRFNRGWEGRNVIVMNVLDREQMDWHRDNKHSMLLSRNISEGQGGMLFIDEGVPVYGFYTQIVTNLFKNYGNWNNYDIGITRTGQQQSPYSIINASAYAAAGLPELKDYIKPFVSLEALTEEEASWKRYDLTKIFGTTTYTKLLNKLQVAFQTIDARLGTTFYNELKELADKEAEERAARNAANGTEEPAEDDASTAGVTEEVTTTASVATRATRTVESAPAPTAGLAADKIAALKGYEALDPSMQAAIIDVTMSGDKVADIMYDTTDGLVACPDCKIASPESFIACPNCGLSFV